MQQIPKSIHHEVLWEGGGYGSLMQYTSRCQCSFTTQMVPYICVDQITEKIGFLIYKPKTSFDAEE